MFWTSLSHGVQDGLVALVGVQVIAQGSLNYLFVGHQMQMYGKFSGDSWMYPYQGTPMGNPYISPI